MDAGDEKGDDNLIDEEDGDDENDDGNGVDDDGRRNEGAMEQLPSASKDGEMHVRWVWKAGFGAKLVGPFGAGFARDGDSSP